MRSTSRRATKKCPGLGAPRRKRAPKPWWAFGWLDGETSAADGCPGLSAPRRNRALKPVGTFIRPRQSRFKIFLPPTVAALGRLVISETSQEQSNAPSFGLFLIVLVCTQSPQSATVVPDNGKRCETLALTAKTPVNHVVIQSLRILATFARPRARPRGCLCAGQARPFL